MYHVRRVTTASGATAIQVVEYVKRVAKVRVHIGSAHSDNEMQSLVQTANQWIERKSGHASLFHAAKTHSPLDAYRYAGIRHTFTHEVLRGILARFGFTALGNTLLHDLIIIRVVEPASKLRSITLIKRYFGITHRRRFFYESLKTYLPLKGAAESCTVEMAKEEFAFDFSIVFYDVTTLYFETFDSDVLRKPGFSKDNKPQQPQIMLAVVVTKEGFPIAYDIFPGNTFEGHTMIPVIRTFQKKYGIKTLTVVADAGMISEATIKALQENDLRYIVGARMGTLDLKDISRALGARDGRTMRIKTKLGDLVCHFSAKRYAKDKREMEKQLKRARDLVNAPGNVKRAKFVQSLGASYALNEEMLAKTKLRLGIKGYYTNTKVKDATVVEQYRQLWHVEAAFRMAKSDLATRPVFHFKENPIRAHVRICFMALAVSKYMEIKTGLSIRKILDSLKDITDVLLVNKHTKEMETLRSSVTSAVATILEKLALPH